VRGSRRKKKKKKKGGAKHTELSNAGAASRGARAGFSSAIRKLTLLEIVCLLALPSLRRCW
jgi:hypothetical protein